MDDDSADEPTLDELLASSMDAEPELLRFLPELLRDVEDLGARASDVVGILKYVALGAQHRVLDLGCGKGAAALAIAERTGSRVDCVDGVPAFVAHAVAEAQRRGLADWCTFEVGDVRDSVTVAQGYDVVMLLALGPLFGNSADTVGVLRQCVAQGGYVLIDDAYLAEGYDIPEDASDCFDHATTVSLLEAHGDRVVAERVIDTDEDIAWYREVTEKIILRADELAALHPDEAPMIMEFAERQRRETEHLAGPIVGALWLVEIC